MIDIVIFGRRVIIAYNTDPVFKYGICRERWGTAYGCWPLLIGVGKPNGVK